MRRYGLVVLLISLLNIESAQADFAAGAQAYDGGDYATAFNEWQEPAKTGNLAAMVPVTLIFIAAGRAANPMPRMHSNVTDGRHSRATPSPR